MKASELRIGNYVNVLGQVDKVSLIGENKNGGYCHFEETRPGYYLENYNDELVTGIELTEEWLIKMGSEKLPHFTISNSIYLKTKRNQQLSFGSVGTPNLMVFLQEIENGNITDLIAIHNWDYDGELYVHQLQNLFFSLCGEELTIKN